MKKCKDIYAKTDEYYILDDGNSHAVALKQWY